MDKHGAQGNNLVEFEQVSFLREDRMIFSNINLVVQQGKITAIMGPSGSGKTTLLKLIAGLLRPPVGRVLVNQQDIGKMGAAALNTLRMKMGMLFQSSALFTGLNVFENVAFPLREHTMLSESMIRDIVLMKLQAVGLRGARSLMPRELSGGMSRRVALARSIALDPVLVMYDEPFAGQDPIAMGVLMQLIRLLNDALGMTSIIVSHDVKETLSIADYIYVIAGGQMIGQGPAETLQRKDNAQMQQFLQGLPDGPVPFHYPAQDYRDDLMLES